MGLTNLLTISQRKIVEILSGIDRVTRVTDVLHLKCLKFGFIARKICEHSFLRNT